MPVFGLGSLRSFKVLIPGILILGGVFARGWDLTTHFAHIDDLGVAKTIIDVKRLGGNDLFAIPSFWTYAPFQFLLTHFLIHPDQTYRELLFWGRLPSFLAGAAGLFAALFFYRRWEPKTPSAAWVGLALTAFSWENIIYAKQSHNYALGVTACFFVLILLAGFLNRQDFSSGRMAAAGLWLALLSTMQYQILFLVPAFFLSLVGLAVFLKKNVFRSLGALAVGAAVYGAAVLPLLVKFLSRRVHAGVVNWNRGPDDEFIFILKEGASLQDQVLYAVRFYLGNFFTIFQSNTGVIPYEHPLSGALSLLLFILFLCGMAGYALSRDPRKRFFGLFIALVLGVWGGLVFLQKITLSPTRHSLILLPLMVVTVTEGLGFILGKARLTDGKIRMIHGALAVSMFLLFFNGYPSMVRERKDPFDEQAILETLRRYRVDALLAVNETIHPGMMKSIEQYFGNFYAPGYVGVELFARRHPYHTLAWISHRDPLTPEKFEEVRRDVIRYNILRRRNIPPLTEPLDAYVPVYSQMIDSDVEIEFSNATRDGANNFYFVILRRKNALEYAQSRHRLFPSPVL